MRDNGIGIELAGPEHISESFSHIDATMAFTRWAALGLFEVMHDRLREQWRARPGRHTQPTAAVLGAQSTRNSPQGGNDGYDAAKHVRGRKRHPLVDTHSGCYWR